MSGLDWKSWGRLVRVPNTLTAVADVFAGAALVQGTIAPIGSFLLLALSSTALYWAGMVFNDVFDVEEDRARNRPRPIPRGEISLLAATRCGWILLVLGVGLAAFSPIAAKGYLDLYSSLPAVVALMLALHILAYDRWLKSLWIAPWVMGACRAINILLGASIAFGTRPEIDANALRPLACVAIGQFLYVSGFTWAARNEAEQSHRSLLVFGWLVAFSGIGVLALAPSQSSFPQALHMDPYRWYPILIAMLAFPVVRRAIVAIQSRSPMAVQASIKQAIMTIILLDAAVTLEFAGPWTGSICCLMILPSLWMGKWFRST